MNGRLHYVDHLRVAAFAVLIAYHSSVAFFPDMRWLIESPEKSALLSEIMNFPRAWRLALLFFVSGMGTWFAFRSTTGVNFLKERTVRLLVPLIFAMCVVVVPQVWYERMHEHQYEGSLFTFWITRYFTEGKYPDGNFTWAHMWFVGYLLVMAVLFYPLFRMIMHPRMRWLAQAFERFATSPAIYFAFLMPLFLNLVLTPFFPRQTNALYNDGAWFAVWASWFGLGFLVARHHRAVIGTIIERRWLSAGLAALATLSLYLFAWRDPATSVGSYDAMTPLFKALVFVLAWAMILALVGFAALHLNRKSAAMTWLNRKIFPLYIVHQTVTVAALFYVLPLDIGVYAKFALVLLATALLSLAFAALADRLPWPVRALFGLSGQPQAQPREAEAVSVRF
ncbi:MAG: acyltransferase family protein [Rhizobiaceae bacterium]